MKLAVGMLANLPLKTCKASDLNCLNLMKQSYLPVALLGQNTSTILANFLTIQKFSLAVWFRVFFPLGVSSSKLATLALYASIRPTVSEED